MSAFYWLKAYMFVFEGTLNLWSTSDYFGGFWYGATANLPTHEINS